MNVFLVFLLLSIACGGVGGYAADLGHYWGTGVMASCAVFSAIVAAVRLEWDE